MFDVSFTELMVIGLVALIVIGPERLPRVARTAGHLLGKLQRYVSTVKADINREMHIEDLKRFEQSVKQEVGAFGSSVNHEIQEIESAARIDPLADAAPAPIAALADGGSPAAEAPAMPAADASAVPPPL